MRLKIVPCTLKRAKAFVSAYHRHHKEKLSSIFCVAVVDESNTVRGVAQVGWPVARNISDGLTIEVNRVATDGCKNACSALLGACRRIAFEMGYRRIITYTLHEEGGVSLRGAGWMLENESAGAHSKKWHTRPGRYVDMDNARSIKCRWVSYNSRANAVAAIWPNVKECKEQTDMFKRLELDGGQQ